MSEHYNQQDKVMYHGTPAPFKAFSETDDIGFHFGSKKAAMARLLKTGGNKPDIEIEHVTLNNEKNIFAEASALLTSGQPLSSLDRVFAVVASRLSSPPTDLRQTLHGYSETGRQSLSQEYGDKGLSLRFIQHLLKENQGEHYRILFNGHWTSTAGSAEHARHIANTLKQEPLKGALLSLQNVIRLPDLGTWPAGDIAKHLALDASDKQQFSQLDTQAERYGFLRAWLLKNDIQGIVYVNKVEAPGTESVIVLDAGDIKLTSAGYPDPHPHLNRLASIYNEVYQQTHSTLELSQIAKQINSLLCDEWLKIEDIAIFRGEIEGPESLFNEVVQMGFSDYAKVPALAYDHLQQELGHTPNMVLKRN